MTLILILRKVSKETVVLGGVKASVLDIGLKVGGFNPAEGDGFLKAIKIRSTPSFAGEVKPSVPCRKTLRHVKNPFEA
jgi:hypothetical protein